MILIIFALPHGLLAFQVTEQALRITGDPYGRTIERSDLKPSEAKRIDLEIEPIYRLTARTNGTGMPNYQSGWFNTKGVGKALVFASDWTHAVLIPTKLNYSLILTPESPDSFLADLSKPLHLDTSFLLATPPGHTPGVPPGMIWLWAILIGVPGVAGLFIIGICVRSRRVMFELSPTNLHIKGDLYGRTIPLASLKLNEASLVNLKTGSDQLTLLRVNGVGMPGYSSGWHRYWKTKASYLLFVTDFTRVVRISTDAGYTLLISPAAPESFLAAIRQFIP